jgi:hypothetical protein
MQVTDVGLFTVFYKGNEEGFKEEINAKLKELKVSANDIISISVLGCTHVGATAYVFYRNTYLTRR